jgi:hypothetical protein
LKNVSPKKNSAGSARGGASSKEGRLFCVHGASAARANF